MGGFGFVGNFLHAATSSTVSIKVVIRADAVKARMDERVMRERNILAALTNKLLKATGQQAHKYLGFVTCSGGYCVERHA